MNAPFRKHLLGFCIAFALAACNPPTDSDSAAPRQLPGTQTPAPAAPVEPPPQISGTAKPEEFDVTAMLHDEPARMRAAEMMKNGAMPASVGFAATTDFMPQANPSPGSENYTHRDANGVHLVSEEPLSTFSIDVDTASYANVRRFLNGGTLPHPDAVRTEELVNYFHYDYAPPARGKTPFSIHTEAAPAPWNAGRVLLRIGIQGLDVTPAELPPANLVFLLDVSGSMDEASKLPLLKNALRLLAHQMRAQDRVSIVVYAGAAGLVLEPTAGNDQVAIDAAIERLAAGGSTNGEGGIRLAYETARRAFVPGGINRVILATDGDFNVGVSDTDDLKHMIEERRASGISLSTLGFGYGNLNDALLNELAEIGNGNSAYIDSALEARKVLVEQMGGTLHTIAKDVKLQVEFSPRVAEYRLIGYKSRMLAREDFNNDAKDAGEIGAGHSVTALYELTLAGSGTRAVDPLRYGPKDGAVREDASAELAFVKVRYKKPDASTSELVTQPVRADAVRADLAGASADFRFAAAVAAFGQKLARNTQLGDYGYPAMIELANGARGADRSGYREEFVRLARLADTLAMAAPVVASASTD